MAWIKIDQALPTHRKTYAVADQLGIPPVQVVGHLTCLWLWTLDNAPDGSLAEVRPQTLARAAQYGGDPVEFMATLVAAGFIDVGDQHAIHDWLDYAGLLVQKREANATRMRAARAAHATRTEAERAMHVQSTCDARAGARVEKTREDKRRQEKSKDVSQATPATAPLPKPAQRFSEDSTEIALARHLQERILGNDQLARTPASLQGWAKDIDLLLRIDKRSPEDVRAAIDWATADPFWSTNILSAFSLRKHYTRLSLQQRQKPPRQNGPTDPTMTKEQADGLDQFISRTAIQVSTDDCWPGRAASMRPV